MNKSEMIRELLSEYQNQRMRNEQELSRRIAEAGRIDPEIIRLRDENRDLAFETMKKIMTLPNEAEKREAAQQMKQRGIFNNGEIRRRLKAAGLPENHLDLQYRCNVCKDTAYVGDAPSRFCDCFENRLRTMQYEDGSMSGTDEQCFERFNLDLFSEENGLRDKMANFRRGFEDYANAYPNTRLLNLFFTGTSGLGKTFLLNCIYERVVSRGHAAVRVSAFRMFEAMRKQHFANSPEDFEFDQLIAAPMLLIDDLGSEPMMRNITIEYLFTLLNERMNARRHTVIATNLTLEEIKQTYGDRVYSRLIDHSRWTHFKFTGKDLRRL